MIRFPDLHFEYQAGYHPSPDLYRVIVGVDEVGRGCLAGPVVAGAVALPAHLDLGLQCLKSHPLAQVRDSKRLTTARRETLAPHIHQWAAKTGIGIATVEEIDQINIFQASHLAMVRAIQALNLPETHLFHILIDGKFLPRSGLPAPATAIIQGDQKSFSIAAASIIAKVWRDQQMHLLDQQYPGYGLSQHKGYPTALHIEALEQKGMSAIHRRSFGKKLRYQHPLFCHHPAKQSLS